MTTNIEPSDAGSAETNSFASEFPPAGAPAPKAKIPRASKRSAPPAAATTAIHTNRARNIVR